MNLAYACIPMLVLLPCLAETYRYLSKHFLEEWYIEERTNPRTGKPERVPRHRAKWTYTAQGKHSRLETRAVASLVALALSIAVWLKLAVGEPDLPGIFSASRVLITFGLSALIAFVSYKALKHYSELLHWQFDVALHLLSVSLPFAANSLLFAIIHMVA